MIIRNIIYSTGNPCISSIDDQFPKRAFCETCGHAKVKRDSRLMKGNLCCSDQSLYVTNSKPVTSIFIDFSSREANTICSHLHQLLAKWATSFAGHYEVADPIKLIEFPCTGSQEKYRIVSHCRKASLVRSTIPSVIQLWAMFHASEMSIFSGSFSQLRPGVAGTGRITG